MISDSNLVKSLVRFFGGVHIVAVIVCAFSLLAVAAAMVTADSATAFFMLKYGLLTMIGSAIVARLTRRCVD